MKADGVIRVKSAVLFFTITLTVWGVGPELDQARKLYQLTEFEKSLHVLQSVPDKARDAAEWELIGKSYYGMADYKKATEALERAVALDPENAESYLWLGR